MSEKQVLIISVVVLVVILLAGGGAGYYFQFVMLDELTKTRDQLRARVADMEAKVRKIDYLREEIKKLELEEAELLEKVPTLDRKEYDTFANLLDDLRRRAGVEIPNVRWATKRGAPVPGRQGARASARLHRVDYDLSVEGPFYQILRLLNLVEGDARGPRYIAVAEFGITPGSFRDEGPPQHKLKLHLFSYTYKPVPEKKIIITMPARQYRDTRRPPE